MKEIKNLRIGLNLLHAFPDIGGVWNYMAGLLEALGKYDSKNTYIAFTNKYSHELVPQKPNFYCQHTHVNPRYRALRIIYENFIFDLKSGKFDLDCMHWFANVMAPLSRMPGIVTVHDLLFFHQSEAFSVVKRYYLKTAFKLTVKKAKMLLPISSSTLLDINTIHQTAARNTLVLPPVIDDRFEPADESSIYTFKKQYGLPDQYFLYVAHIYPHKNHSKLLQAYHHLKNNGFKPWPLVLRGDEPTMEGEMRKTINALNLEDDVISLPRISPQQMKLLYSGAGVLIHPSLFEGGGIPVIEAMACGCPVAASKIPAVEEFSHNAALLFDPSSHTSIGIAMNTIQIDAELREKLVKKGFEIVGNHHGGNIVQKLLSAYEMAARG